MLALLASLLGFGGSIIPKLFEAFQDRRDKAHELELLVKQASFERQKADANLEATLAVASSNEFMAVQNSYSAEVSANKDVGNAKMLAFQSSVRPVISYSFFALYAGIKIAQFYLLTHPHLIAALPWQTPATALSYAQALTQLWGQEDMALFSTIISFWFGDRIINRK